MHLLIFLKNALGEVDVANSMKKKPTFGQRQQVTVSCGHLLL